MIKEELIMSEIISYDLITVEELAEALGVSKNSAYALLKNGSVKSFKIGTHYKIPSSAIDDYIKRMTGLPIPNSF